MSQFSGTNLTCIRGERVVFEALDFSIGEGEVLCLRGRNGSGKSSLIRVMAGLLGVVEGDMSWNAEPLLEDPEGHRARLHYVGHQDAIKTALTVTENLTFWAEMSGVETDKQTVPEALETFSLSNLAKLPARFLSAGQRRRLNLARIVASPAPLWLLDEPTNSLDKESVTTLYDAIATHRQKGGMVVLATHDDLTEDVRILDLGQFEMKPAPRNGAAV